MAELHAEFALALGGSSQVRAEAEHGVETALGNHGELVGTDLSINNGTALVHQHEDGTLELSRGSDGGLHEGLQNLTAGLGEGLAESHLGSQVESVITGIGNVGGTIGNDEASTDNSVAEEGALHAGLFEALAASAEVLFRNVTTNNAGLEVVGLGVLLVGLNEANDASVITRATGLALEQEVKLGLAADGLAVSDAGLASLAVHLVLAAQTLNVNFEMQFAHTADDGLLRLLVDVQTESRILTHEAVHGLGELIGIAAALGLDAEGHDGVGYVHGAHAIGQTTIGESVTRGALNTKHGANLAGTNLGNILHLIGVHADDTGDADLLVSASVEQVLTLLQRALINTHVCELTVRVLFELEGKADERQRVERNERNAFLSLGPVESMVGDILGVGKIVADGIKHGLDGFVGKRGTHQHRSELQSNGGSSDGGLDLGGGRGDLLQVHLGDLIVYVGQLFNKLLSLLLGQFLELRGNFLGHFDVDTTLTIVSDGPHLDKINDTLKLLFGADGDLDSSGRKLELIVDHLDGLEGVGAHTVHLVDEADAGNVVALHLTIDSNGLTLNTADGAKHHDGTIQNSHSSLDLNSEVDMAGRVDQVEMVSLLLAVGVLLLPIGEGGGRLNGDTSLSLKFHRVHLGADAITAADFVNSLGLSGVEEDALGDGSLAAVDVCLWSCSVSALQTPNCFLPLFPETKTYCNTNVPNSRYPLGLLGCSSCGGGFGGHVRCGQLLGLLQSGVDDITDQLLLYGWVPGESEQDKTTYAAAAALEAPALKVGVLLK